MKTLKQVFMIAIFAIISITTINTVAQTTKPIVIKPWNSPTYPDNVTTKSSESNFKNTISLAMQTFVDNLGSIISCAPPNGGLNILTLPKLKETLGIKNSSKEGDALLTAAIYHLQNSTKPVQYASLYSNDEMVSALSFMSLNKKTKDNGESALFGDFDIDFDCPDYNDICFLYNMVGCIIEVNPFVMPNVKPRK